MSKAFKYTGLRFWTSRAYISSKKSRSHFIELKVHPFAYVLGICTIGGAAVWYTWSPYDQEAKKHLRSAIKGHYYIPSQDAGERYIKAIKQAISSGMKEEDEEVLGIYLHLAQFYKDNMKDPVKALKIYDKLIRTWWSKGESRISYSDNKELRKAVGIAQEMAEIYSSMKMNSQAERLYKWSLELMLGTPEILSDVLSNKYQPKELESDSSVYTTTNHDHKEIPVMKIKPWATSRDIGSCLLTMAQFYHSKDNNPMLALPLYMRSLQFINKDSESSWFGEDLQLNRVYIMINISSAFLQVGDQKSAEKWALDAIKISESMRNSQEGVNARTSSLIAMGNVFKTSSSQKALNCFREALMIAKSNGLEEHADHAYLGINELKKKTPGLKTS